MDKRAPDNRSIGVFDSGMGGLTAVRRLHALMPKENIIYFGDTSRVPYGTRGRDTIVKYARQDVAFLRQFDLKAIVIACNTVSSVALDLLTEENNIPIIGTVEPACRRAMTMTQNGRVGVIGTAATMRSGAYEKYLHKKDGTLRLYTQACPLFVPLVENGRVHRGDIVIETVAAEYLAPLKEAGVPLEVIIRNISAGSFAKRFGVEEGIVFDEPTIEFSYKNDDLGDPLMNAYHAVALKAATREEIETIKSMAFKVNEVMKQYFDSLNVILVDFKLEFGKTADGKIVLADEISPDTCRLWDKTTKEKLDKDRFRRDLGGVEEAYQEIMKRVMGK